jgi:Domain of unknown function (DUF4351)
MSSHRQAFRPIYLPMLSYLHEVLLLLFRNNSKLAAELLQRLQVEVPPYSDVQIASADLTDLKPAEYRADLVLLLLHEARTALGIIVEVQLSVDDEKQYAWPAYVVNLRARIRCPVCLLVIAVDASVARWAARLIELGGGSRIVPWVMGPTNIPAITDLHQAESDVELAVLSAQAHARDADIGLVARIASAAILASAGIDAERSKMYLDLIVKSLPEDALRALRNMNPVVHEYMSDFARQYVAEGRAEVILRLLTLRFGPLTEAIQSRVRKACSEQLNSVADGLLTVKTLEEALSAL